tara:strand:- start:414 stop:947 length:534 start_codon:yes stop_codon:yes gene_type:complete
MNVRKRRIMLISLIAIIIIAILFSQSSLFKESSSSQTNSGKTTPSEPKINPCSLIADPFVAPDFDEAISAISQDPLIGKIPSSGSIRLRFYHFKENCRVWDNSYLITKGSISQSNNKADIDIWVDSSYAPKLKEQGLCSTIQEAKAAGHFGSKTELSKTKLTFRYAKLLPSKSCFGL